jgi:hypothetical protein
MLRTHSVPYADLQIFSQFVKFRYKPTLRLMADTQFYFILLIIGSILVPIVYYKAILPVVESLYKILLILVGTLIFWGCSLGIYVLLTSIEADPVLSVIIAIISGVFTSTPYYLVARIYTRLEKLELDAKYDYSKSSR